MELSGKNSWYRYDAKENILVLSVYVQPGASKSEIVGLHGDALKIRVAAPAVDGQASKSLIRFLAGALAIPQKSIRLTRGQQSRNKLIAISAPLVNLESLLNVDTRGV